MEAAINDPERFVAIATRHGHSAWTGIGYHAADGDWVELVLPFDPKLVGDVERGVLASGAIFTLMDLATSCAVAQRLTTLRPFATLDLRLDYLRPATAGMALIGRAECYRLTRRVAFVRGTAYHGTIDDPVAHAVGTFMFTDPA